MLDPVVKQVENCRATSETSADPFKQPICHLPVSKTIANSTTILCKLHAFFASWNQMNHAAIHDSKPLMKMFYCKLLFRESPANLSGSFWRFYLVNNERNVANAVTIYWIWWVSGLVWEFLERLVVRLLLRILEVY